ncbi:MAG: AAA family ATPase [Planctomycetota bacterium]|nr:AAA family ATPase [Planctomycetota bacterium]
MSQKNLFERPTKPLVYKEGTLSATPHPSAARPDSTRTAAGQAYLLIGPPGCGKTTALAMKWVPKAVERYGPEAVMLSSLTRAAAQEIASRDIGVPDENVGTLHSLALRALKRPPLAQTRKHLVKWNELVAPHFRLSGGGKSEGASDKGKFKGDALLEMCDTARHKLVPVDAWNRTMRDFWSKWCQWKLDNELMDFTDLIIRATDWTDHAPGDPAVFIVDEAQDLSKLELALVQHWGASTETYVLAGDFDQAIFAWRGADANAFMSLDIPEERIYRLTQSYRVPRAVQAYASKWIDQVEERFPSEYLPRDEEGEIQRRTSITLSSGRKLVRELAADLELGHSTMLLASCGYMLNHTLSALRKAGIPFHNPYRPEDPAWNPMRGGVDRLACFLRPVREELCAGAEPRLWTWPELKRWLEPLTMGNDFVKGAKVLTTKQAKGNPQGGSVSRTDLRSVFTDEGYEAVVAAVTGPAQGAVDWYFERVRGTQHRLMSFARTLVRYNLPIAREANDLPTSEIDSPVKGEIDLRRLVEVPRLIVGTIHSVKGSGADSVFLAPDLSRASMKEYQRRGAKRDETIRLMYVGQTRAIKKLTLLGPYQECRVNWLPL